MLDKLSLVQLPEVYRLKTPTRDISVPQQNPQAYIELLAGHFPAEAEGIRGFVREMIGIAEEVDTLSRRKGKFFKPIFPLQYRKMWNVRNKTLADLIGAYIEDPELQHVLSALWGYYGLPPSKLSGFYYAVATGDYLKNGSYYIKNRSQDLSDAIADAIEAAGGKIIYDTAVERILLQNGHVAGVELSDGDKLQANAVVSNASALTTMTRMLPPEVVPTDYMDRLRS